MIHHGTNDLKGNSTSEEITDKILFYIYENVPCKHINDEIIPRGFCLKFWLKPKRALYCYRSL